MANSKYFAVILLFALITGSHGLDEEGAKEQSCFNISNTVKVDLEWFGSMKTIYYPLMSRLDLYRVVKDFFPSRGMGSISEAEVYYDSCIEFVASDDGGFVHKGFHGRTFKPVLKPLDAGMERVRFTSDDGNSAYSGICHSTLTDNKTFLFVACCADDNEMSWGVVSPNKTLPKETISLIHEHAQSLGFKQEYFTAIRYDLCGSQGGLCEDSNDVVKCLSA